MTTAPDLNEQFRIRDGGRIVTFRGVKLAEATSARPDSTRWTDLTIYRTDGGNFICHRIGVSEVIHVQGCIQADGRKYPGIFDIKDDELAADLRTPCSACRPDVKALLHSDPAALLIETDRHWVSVSETAAAMIQSLHTSRAGTRSLPTIAAGAVMEAAEKDPDIYEAYSDIRIQ